MAGSAYRKEIELNCTAEVLVQRAASSGLVQVAENQTTPPQLVAEGPFSIYTVDVAGETKIRAQVGLRVGGGGQAVSYSMIGRGWGVSPKWHILKDLSAAKCSCSGHKVSPDRHSDVVHAMPISCPK